MKWQMKFLNCKIEFVKHVYRTGRLFKLKDIQKHWYSLQIYLKGFSYGIYTFHDAYYSIYIFHIFSEIFYLLSIIKEMRDKYRQPVSCLYFCLV